MSAAPDPRPLSLRLDEPSRPRVTAPGAAAALPAHQASRGRHLLDVHDHLRAELASVRDMVDQVATGALDAVTARSRVSTMTMRQNNWTLGAYCASYCRLLTLHHTIEDQSMFPHLRAADPRLAPVIDRLEEEHHVIHAVLEGLDRALVSLVGVPGEAGAGADGAAAGLTGLRQAVDALSTALLSHLAYEEEELVEPLGRTGLL